MQNLKYDADELVYKTERNSQRTSLWLPRVEGGWIGGLGLADANYFV